MLVFDKKKLYYNEIVFIEKIRMERTEVVYHHGLH